MLKSLCQLLAKICATIRKKKKCQYLDENNEVMCKNVVCLKIVKDVTTSNYSVSRSNNISSSAMASCTKHGKEKQRNVLFIQIPSSQAAIDCSLPRPKAKLTTHSVFQSLCAARQVLVVYDRRFLAGRVGEPSWAKRAACIRGETPCA